MTSMNDIALEIYFAGSKLEYIASFKTSFETPNQYEN